MASIESSLALREDFSNSVNNINIICSSLNIASIKALQSNIAQTVAGVEKLNDELHYTTEEQEQLDKKTNKSVQSLEQFKNKLSGIVKKLDAMADKAFNFAQDCLKAFDVQNNAEIQLFGALANNPDDNLVAQFAVDTSQAISDINGIQGEVGEVTIGVSARTQAVNAAFDKITEKASEIQSRGIYSDEAMIAAGAEFSTYFSDSDAIAMMMDTLTNYAMGMSGGGEIDAAGMAGYAADLGNIMSGAYDTMTKNCFTFSDAQRAIIEGEATREQIVSALGEDYLNMSSDMQAAAAIAQVVDEAWAGLYESMSNTPQGKIIQLNNAWGNLTEVIGGRLYPCVVQFVDIITENWPTIESVVQGISGVFQTVLGVLSWIMQAAFSVVDIISNWSMIVPIVEAVAIALGLVVAAYGLYKIATETAALATKLFDAALLSCPLTWVIILVIALTAAFAAFTEQIVGSIWWLGALFKNIGLWIANVAIGVWNTIKNIGLWFTNLGLAASAIFYNIGAAVVNFFSGIGESVKAIVSNIGIAFSNAWTWIQIQFWSLVDAIMQGLKSIAEFANTVLGWMGVDIDTSAFDFAKDKINELNEQYQDFQDVGEAWEKGSHTFEYKDVGAAWNTNEIDWAGGWEKGYNTFDVFEEGWGTDDYNAGAEIGAGLHDNIMGMFNFLGNEGSENEDDNWRKMLEQMEDLNNSNDDIYGNTNDISDSIGITEEDLKYLRDTAEQESVNRFTTAEITIEQNNNNNISSTLDLDGVVNGLTDAVNEAVAIIAEGVHA